MKATNAIQFAGSRIANVPKGGRKKKFKLRMPTTDAHTAGAGPHARAMKRIINRKASATVVGLMCGPNSLSGSVVTPTAQMAITNPNDLDLTGEKDLIRTRVSEPRAVATGSRATANHLIPSLPLRVLTRFVARRL